MRKIAILSDQADSPTLSNLASQLTEAGFQVKFAWLLEGEEPYTSELKEAEDSSAVVAVVERPNNNLFIHLAYLLGRGSNVWIISKDFENLPGILRRASFVKSEGRDTNNILIDQIRERLQIDVPTADDMKDLYSLVSWLREDTDRITGLSSKDFERLVLTILSDVGLHYESAMRTPEMDMVFSDPQSRTLVFVEVKSYTAGQKLGVGAVERSVANAMSHGCDFTVLVCPNDFTRTAWEYSKLCAPPVWLLGRDILENWIIEKFEHGRESRKDTKRFFVRMLQRRGRLLNTSSDVAGESESALSPNVKLELGGKWLTSLLDWEFKRLQVKRLRHQTETRNFEIFFSFNRDEKTKEVEQLTQLIHLLHGEGVSVWHDSPLLNVGTACMDMNDVTNAVRRSDLVFYFLGHGTGQSVSDSKVLQTVASEIARSPEEQLKTFIIGVDNVWNRLKLPSIFTEAVFLDTTDDHWRNAIFELYRKIAEAIRSSPKEVSE